MSKLQICHVVFVKLLFFIKKNDIPLSIKAFFIMVDKKYTMLSQWLLN